ncbi:hypothetical protein FRACYDRAFT_240033 [Fragilariopsis cylindrus CCMP1102]|uniref:Uncharacterized protein n=1 Tax=Fragilariopsis cylindrus CCMP1102 TaxID=635003 RepID=A0A1E7FB07_9STRA|nr:hypothetical protein FRACYDRAFT_240033 [Fragilariopsis cylindrus CCMP1102]|eukprot:OEU15348.1 hypothetical protein FRACYDRAFT_240033 [Fragilariopsis cylindrus CCMP1102]
MKYMQFLIFLCSTFISDTLAGQKTSAVSVNELGSFWTDSVDVLDALDEYEKLWIEPHGCVWSECAINDADDAVMGDYRDGDSQWYQYRTQNFCANAAFSLYGQKRGDKGLFSLFSCSQRHFINSFFTYGGADSLLKAIGETPIVYYDDGDQDDNNDDGSGGTSANAACVEIDYEGGDTDTENDEDDEDDEDNDNEGSQDNNDEYTGTLGCAADGSYVIAAFQSSSCDGNFFSGTIDDSFTEYNEQHSSIGCHEIYKYGNEASVESVIALLENSWSCDIQLYPNGCPDPFGQKEKFDYALRTVAHGGNPTRAYQNMMITNPLHIATWVVLALTAITFIIVYLKKNKKRTLSKGGNNFTGYYRVLKEDIINGWEGFVGYLKGNVVTCRKNHEEERLAVVLLQGRKRNLEAAARAAKAVKAVKAAKQVSSKQYPAAEREKDAGSEEEDIATGI